MVKKSPRSDVEIPEVSMPEFMLPRLLKYGDAIALVDNGSGKIVTFKQVYDNTRRLASALHKCGVRKGDMVCICAPTSSEYAVAMLAISSCGAIVTTCNPSYTEGEMIHQFKISEPKFIFVSNEAVKRLKKVAEVLPCIKEIFVIGQSEECKSYDSLLKNEDGNEFPENVTCNVKEDIFVLPYSSGTTGLPKSVMVTHWNYVGTLAIIERDWPIVQNACYYMDRPMYHGGGYGAMLLCLSFGIKLVFDRVYEIEQMFQAIEKYKVTYLLAVPPIVIALSQTSLQEKYDASSLTHLITGGAPIAPQVLKEVKKRFNVVTNQGYGLTECPVIAQSDFNKPLETSVGMIIRNTTIKVIDIQSGKELRPGEDGEILVSSPLTMKGYYKNPEATARTIDEDGWLHTGDIGHYDDEGLLYIVDRLKEVIKYRAFQVPPAELESVLLKHPLISDVGVIGVPHPTDGEVPRAYVVPKDPNLTEEEVKKFVEGELADYKHLRGGVKFIENISRTLTGKIQRQELRKLVKES